MPNDDEQDQDPAWFCLRCKEPVSESLDICRELWRDWPRRRRRILELCPERNRRSRPPLSSGPAHVKSAGLGLSLCQMRLVKVDSGGKGSRSRPL